jgi:transcriptional regulator with XRE-family HTH domain
MRNLVQSKINMGKAFRFWREVYKIDQSELARRMGTSRTWISKIENQHTHPTLDSCSRCAQAFGIPMRVLVLTAMGLDRNE